MEITESVPGSFEVWLCLSEPVPDRLFVCNSKIKADEGVALKNKYVSGTSLPKTLESIHNEHLIYQYDLGENQLFWEAGPSTDFAETICIFSTTNMEEAQMLMHDDPFYKNGIFYDDWWFEWSIHAPYWKQNLLHREAQEVRRRSSGILPYYPPGVKPQKHFVEVVTETPPKLFALFTKCDAKRLLSITEDLDKGTPFEDNLIRHSFYINHIAAMGYLWECGPSADHFDNLVVLSVDSIETARFLIENEPMAKYNVWYDRRYFEWCIHMPFRKASPAYKETIKRFLTAAGIKLQGQ